MLPFTEDVLKLIKYINENIDDLDKFLEVKFDEKLYRRYLLFVMLGILVLNRICSDSMYPQQFQDLGKT